MYRKKNEEELEFENFYTPFGGKLRSDNRWVKMRKLLPHEAIEEKYAEKFADSGMGAPAKSAQIAIGALIIKEIMGFTDEETVQEIQENPYMQYFIGLSEYQYEAPFDPSMMVHFRKRLDLETVLNISEMMIEKYKKDKDDSDDPPHASGTGKEEKGESETQNKGKLITDATCVPADIRFPTDLSLLNEGREVSENIIDILFDPLKGTMTKPKTYRQNAHYEYLKTSKKRNPSHKEIRKAIGKQLRYIKRNLAIIEKLKDITSLTLLNSREYKQLFVVAELYRQQLEMWQERKHSIEGRIVSISQPHLRPIVRGKAGVKTEFGPKILVSVIDNFSYIDHYSYENFNESTLLIEQIEKYRQKNGCYPEAVDADKIYLTKANRAYCKEKNIRLSGPPLGRPRKNIDENELKEQKRIAKQDGIDRIAIEGKFGQGKRKYGLKRIMTKLAATEASSIAIIFLVMNLDVIMRSIILRLFYFVEYCVFVPIFRFFTDDYIQLAA